MSFYPVRFAKGASISFFKVKLYRDRFFTLYRHVGSNQRVYILKSCRLPACEAFYRTFV